jgi:DNA-binding response OmpR family regulator
MTLERMPAPSPRRPRVLIVDDDKDVREGLARALARAANYEIATAADGFEAGYQFAAFRPDLVLLDIVMPGMGGFDLCERLRRVSTSEKLRIVILTGFSGAGHNEQSLLSGADLFLTKPQDVQSLVMHIEDLLG